MWKHQTPIAFCNDRDFPLFKEAVSIIIEVKMDLCKDDVNPHCTTAMQEKGRLKRCAGKRAVDISSVRKTDVASIREHPIIMNNQDLDCLLNVTLPNLKSLKARGKSWKRKTIFFWVVFRFHIVSKEFHFQWNILITRMKSVLMIPRYEAH